MEKNQRVKRTQMMCSGAFIIFFTGFPHVWSIYQSYAIALTGWSQGQASMCFYLSMGVFVFGNIVGGRIQDSHGPTLTVGIGGGIFTLGILLSAAALRPSPIMIYLTYGVMQGFGQGMIYTTIVSTAQKWFPKKTGMASGIIVAANGFCGFFLAPISRMLLASVGIKITFLIIGSFIGLAWLISWRFVKNPIYQSEEMSKEVSVYKGKQYTAKEMIHTRKFYYLLLTMLFGLISYLIISPMSQVIQMGRGITSAVAVASVMFGSVANAGMRLLLPAVADKKGRINCLKYVLILNIIGMIILTVTSSYLTTLGVILMYAGFGGIMGSFPSLSSSIFGLEHSGENYGYVMIGMVAATFAAPTITAGMLWLGLGQQGALGTGIICAVLSFLFLRMLEKELSRHLD